MPPLLCLALLCAPPAAGPAAETEDGDGGGPVLSAVRLGIGPTGPDWLTVRWRTDRPTASAVRLRPAGGPEEVIAVPGRRRRHTVQIPAGRAGDYAVGDGTHWSADAPLPAVPGEELRVAVVANWQGRPDLAAVRADRPHLLVSAGDHVGGLWTACGAGVTDCDAPFAALAESDPALFRSVPFLPTLGNHDRQIRGRGKTPPPEPVYDPNAVAYRTFFTLPSEDGRRWHLTLPAFGLRLASADLNHTSDAGTTWQSCHAFGPGSDQLRWAEDRAGDDAAFRVTVYNEQNRVVRGLAGGRWGAALAGETCVVSGFGYFAERAAPPAGAAGPTFFNTSLNGRGDRYPDPHSAFLASEDNYVLLRVARGGAMTAELKSLAGETLDRTRFDR